MGGGGCLTETSFQEEESPQVHHRARFQLTAKNRFGSRPVSGVSARQEHGRKRLVIRYNSFSTICGEGVLTCSAERQRYMFTYEAANETEEGLFPSSQCCGA